MGRTSKCRLLRRRAEQTLDRGDGPRDPRLRVHPHRQHQGSDRRAVWRRHAIRRDHRQPAVPAQRRWLWHQRRTHLSTSSSNKRRSSTRAFCRWLFLPAGSLAARGWMNSESRCSPTTACARSTTILARRMSFPGWVSRVASATSSGTATIPGPAESPLISRTGRLDSHPPAS